MNQYIELLEKPFLRNKDLTLLLSVSATTVSKMVKEYGLKKYPWGYSTDEVIQKLNLNSYIKRYKKAQSPTKVD